MKINLIATGEMLLEEYNLSCNSEYGGGFRVVRNRLNECTEKPELMMLYDWLDI